MRNKRLSPDTKRRLNILFAPKDRAAAERMLRDECGNNLPFLGDLDEFQLERFRFAAMKLSKGALHELRKAIDLAQTDWRDLLVAAGFGDDITLHERWSP